MSENGFNLFNWVMGIGGSLVGAISLASGKTIIDHHREIGELKTGHEATSKNLNDLKVTTDKMDGKIDRLVEHLLKEKES